MRSPWLPVILMLVAQVGMADDLTSREVTTCDVEETAFRYWTRAAGNPNISDDDAQAAKIAKVRLRTGDGRMLTGLHLRADSNASDAILVIQGNAWAAVTIAQRLEFLRRAGFDVFVYDFRGYAMSRPANPRLKAIVKDYQEIFADLVRRQYRRLHVYGFSGGGVIAVNAIAVGSGWRSIVVDSAPARLPAVLKCPPNSGLDPIDNLPAHTANMLFISSRRDAVVAHSDAVPLLDAAAARGAEILKPNDWDHPFQPRITLRNLFREKLDSPNNERQKLLIDYFKR